MAEQKTCPACDGSGYFGTPGRIGQQWRCINCAGTGKADDFGSAEHHFSERPAAGVKELDNQTFSASSTGGVESE